jgi:hypothetical protein
MLAPGLGVEGDVGNDRSRKAIARTVNVAPWEDRLLAS